MDFSVLTDNFIFSLVFFGFMGACFGSFASVLTYRVPRQRSWVWEELGENDKQGLSEQGFWKGIVSRSQCPSCLTTLSPRDLVPILSWLLQKGKCRHCGTKIPMRYPLLEIISAALFILVYLQYGWSWEACIICLCVPLFISLFLIDVDFWILPNQLMLGLLGFAVIYNLYYADVLAKGDPATFLLSMGFYATSGLFYYGMGWILRFGYHKITGKEGLGLGDVKFFGLAGFWLGWYLTPVFLLLSCVIGIFFALYWRCVHKSHMFPYGPALVVALFISLLYEDFLSYLFLTI